MAMTTRCPHCGTAFRVVADQLRVRGGLVRCGVCTQIFDGYANIIDTGGPVPELTEAAGTAAAAGNNAPARPVPSVASHPAPGPFQPAGTPVHEASAMASTPVPAPGPTTTWTSPPTSDSTSASTQALTSTPTPTPSPAQASPRAPITTMDTAVVPAPVTAVVPATASASVPLDVRPAAVYATGPAPGAPAVLRGRGDQRRQEPAFHGWDGDGAGNDSASDDVEYDHHVDDPDGAHGGYMDAASSGASPAAIRERAPAQTEPGAGRYRFYVDPDDDPGDYVAIPGEVRTRYDEAVDTGMPPPAFMDDGALRRRAAWHGLWGWGCVLLVIGLALQAVYVYRTAIATEVPALRPVLQTACAAIGCDVGYARRIERISITGSSLQPPATEAGAPADGHTRMVLNVTLRNRYDKPQPWPALVLELTDLSDTVVVRKIITPDAYLPPGTEGPFPAGGERTLAVPVQTTGVQVNGYQLDKFFP